MALKCVFELPFIINHNHLYFFVVIKQIYTFFQTFTDCGCISIGATTTNHGKRSVAKFLSITERELQTNSNNTIQEATTIKAVTTERITNDGSFVSPITYSTATKTQEELSVSIYVFLCYLSSNNLK